MGLSGGVTFTSDDFGANWVQNPQSPFRPTNMMNASCGDASQCVYSIEGGGLALTQNGGQSWALSDVPTPMGQDITDVNCVNERSATEATTGADLDDLSLRSVERAELRQTVSTERRLPCCWARLSPRSVVRTRMAASGSRKRDLLHPTRDEASRHLKFLIVADSAPVDRFIRQVSGTGQPNARCTLFTHGASPCCAVTVRKFRRWRNDPVQSRDHR